MNDSGTQWVTGKVGEWLQGTDESGDPIVFPFTTTSSPFRTLTSIELATNLSIASETQSLSSKHKSALAVKELAAALGVATRFNAGISSLSSPPSGTSVRCRRVQRSSVFFAAQNP